MKIINKSTYQGRDLRKIIIRTVKERGVDPTNLRIYIHKGIRGYIYGRATVGSIGYQGNWVEMFIPPMERFGSDANRLTHVADFYRVLDHEFLHSLGVRHNEMSEPCKYAMGKVPDWVHRMKLREIPIKGAPTREDQKLARYEAALAKVRAWERKAKLAATKLRAWRKKIRYYENILPAAAGRVKKGNK